MRLVDILPWIAGALLAGFMVIVAMRDTPIRRNAWIIPAMLSAIFFLWSLVTALIEGPTGFWVEHTRNMWGNQIWFDLLLAAGVAWFLIVPKARSLNMSLWPWFIFILCTGSIGLLAMVSRVLYLGERTG